MKNTYRQLSATLVLAALAACGSDNGQYRLTGDVAEDASIPQAQRFGGTAVVALGADVADINPLTSSDANANQIQMYVLYTPIVHYNEALEPIPGHARSWELNEDGTQLTFHLRNDIYWHDGVKSTAEDLKFAYDRARDPQTAFPNSSFWVHYGEAAAPDSFTFTVQLTPHAEYMDPWRTFFAMPRHLLEDVPPAELSGHPYSNRNPVGNGPFRFASRSAGQSWTFDANEGYPQELGGRPYLDRLVFRVIPEATTRLAELVRGGVDYYIQVTPGQLDRVENSGSARLVTFRNRSYVYVGWNQRRHWFEDARVRRALTMAINKQGIIDGVLYGHGDVVHTTVPTIYWQADPEIGSELAFDPDRARALLREVGWEDRSGDGVLQDEQGRPFRFTIKTNAGNQERKDLAEVVQSDLRRVGVDAQLQLVEFNSLIQSANDPNRRDFDAIIMGWVAEFKLDDTNLFHCDKIDAPYQWVGHCSPEMDRFLDTLQVIPDRDQAMPVWREYQRLQVEQQPYTTIYAQHRLQGVHNRLRNVNPDARGDLVGVTRWFIHPEMRRAR